jgi:hypothetical protein
MKRVGSVVLLIVPVLVAIIGLYSIRIMLPVYAGINQYDYDPAYVYLLNGVSIFLGLPPGHIDHPGTPTQIVIGMVAGLWWSLFDRGSGTLMDAALANPELYVRVLGLFFLACNVAANWFLGRRVAAAAGSVSTGVVAQTGPLFLGVLAPRLVYLSSEAMLLALGMVVLGLLAEGMFRPGPKAPGFGSSIVAGALSGVAVTAKVTFAPMLAVLFVIPRDRRLVAALLATVVAALLCVSPAYEQGLPMVRWFVGLVTREGRYGVGERGIADAATITAQLRNIGEVIPILYAGLLAAAVAALLRFGRISVAILAAFVLQLCLALKPTQVHYFLSVVPLATVLLAWLVRTNRIGARLAGLAAVLALCLGGLWTVSGFNTLSFERAVRGAQVREFERALLQYPGALVIGTYRVPDLNYALNFAVGYTSTAFRTEVSPKLPSGLSYHRGGFIVSAIGNYGPLRRIDPFLAAGRPVLLAFPLEVPFERFECAEPVWKSVRFHICRVLRVVDPP